MPMYLDTVTLPLETPRRPLHSITDSRAAGCSLHFCCSRYHFGTTPDTASTAQQTALPDTRAVAQTCSASDHQTTRETLTRHDLHMAGNNLQCCAHN